MLPSGPSKNKRMALICVAVLATMTGAGFAAVPLYRMFCQITGFDGTVRKVDVASRVILDRTVAVRFDANVRDMPWKFIPEETSQTVRIGETKMAYFKVVNPSDRAITGQATFNVVPESAGAYFRKLECFCFTEQTLQPGQTMEFPVVYFVEPAYATDEETKGKSEITLSYTFFPTEVQPKAQKTAQSAVQTLGERPQAGL